MGNSVASVYFLFWYFLPCIRIKAKVLMSMMGLTKSKGEECLCKFWDLSEKT